MGSNPASHSLPGLMTRLSKVVWFEGMYLGPHHFQAQRQSFEDLVHFSSSNLWFEPLGLIGYRLDAEALPNGTAALIRARCIFPDGLVFHMPDSDSLPPARKVEEFFPPTQESLKVMLAIPPHRQEGPNCTLPPQDSDANTRYIAEAYPLCDENTGADPRPVHLGRK